MEASNYGTFAAECAVREKEMITIYKQMLFKRQQLDEQIQNIQVKLMQLPEGKLICTRNGMRIKWYQSDGHKKIYIPKKNRKLAEQLAARKYLTLQAESLLHEQKAIDRYLKYHETDINRADQLLTSASGYSELLTPFLSLHPRNF